MNEVATVDVCGVRRQINITCIIDADHPITACVGDWVLVRIGFAMSRIDEAQAEWRRSRFSPNWEEKHKPK